MSTIEQTIFKDDYLSKWREDGQLTRKLQYQALYLHEEGQLKNFNCRRVSLTDPEVFFHNRDSDNSSPENINYCEMVERNKVHVDWATTLEFAYTFKDVEPGNYSISYKVTKEHEACVDTPFMWPDPDDDDPPTELTITHHDGVIKEEIYNEFWRETASDEKYPRVTVTFDGEFEDWWLVGNYERYLWTSVSLSPFIVSTKGDVTFRLRDGDKYKEAFSFDYIQLTKH